MRARIKRAAEIVGFTIGTLALVAGCYITSGGPAA